VKLFRLREEQRKLSDVSVVARVCSIGPSSSHRSFFVCDGIIARAIRRRVLFFICLNLIVLNMDF
jgi:hypothetical protein